MLFHYWDKEHPGQIEQFKQDDDFLINFEDFHQSIFKRPVMGESLGTKPFAVEKPTVTEVEKLTGLSATKISIAPGKTGVIQKLLAWIKA